MKIDAKSHFFSVEDRGTKEAICRLFGIIPSRPYRGYGHGRDPLLVCTDHVEHIGVFAGDGTLIARATFIGDAAPATGEGLFVGATLDGVA